MDRATVYDKAYYNAALKSGITGQGPKAAVAGGNNSGSGAHKPRRSAARWLFPFRAGASDSPASVADKCDTENALRLAELCMLKGICSGEIE